MDFSLKTYRKLLIALKQANYTFISFEEFCESKEAEKPVILRHDVDLKAENSLNTAKIEHELDIKASYYFRVVPQSNKPDIIKQIAGLGHEIGYHYEDVTISKGNQDKGIKHFEKQLNYFRRFYPVVTVCMHGSPTSRYDNRSLWKNYDYHDFGIIGEPYFDFLNEEKEVLYFTDTARMWDGDKYNVRDKRLNDNSANQPHVHSTFDLIEWVKKSKNLLPVMITTHPQRWTDNRFAWTKELISQSIKNKIKQVLVARK